MKYNTYEQKLKEKIKNETIENDNGSSFTYEKYFPHTDKETQFELACKKFGITLTHIPVRNLVLMAY